MLNLDKMQNNSTLIWKKFEIWGRSIFKVIQTFHTVRIVLYIGCSAPVIWSLTAYILILLYPWLVDQNTRYTELCVQFEKLE